MTLTERILRGLDRFFESTPFRMFVLVAIVVNVLGLWLEPLSVTQRIAITGMGLLALRGVAR